MRHTQRGQVTAEVAVLFSFVVAALVAMGFYIQRGAQGSAKSNTDSIGQQFSVTGASGWASNSYSQQVQKDNTVRSSYCADYEHGMGERAGDATIPVGGEVDCDAYPELPPE